MATFTKLPDRIVTELSVEEAATLMLILRNVGGCPRESPRQYADSIYRALTEAGFDASFRNVNDEARNLVFEANYRNGLFFKNNTAGKAWENYTGRALK